MSCFTWLAALLALEAVQAGRLRLPFVHWRPVGGDVEAGLLDVTRGPSTN